jgi:hypothetical protein
MFNNPGVALSKNLLFHEMKLEQGLYRMPILMHYQWGDMDFRSREEYSGWSPLSLHSKWRASIAMANVMSDANYDVYIEI